MVKRIERDFDIGERVTCAHYPLHIGGTKRMPVIVSGVHYDEDDYVIALSVFEVPLVKGNSGQYLKDLRVNQSHYDFKNADLPSHFIDTGTQTTLCISKFDTDRDYIATLKAQYLPDLILRRIYAELRHTDRNDRNLFDMSQVNYSETLANCSELTPEHINQLCQSAETYITQSQNIKWPKLGQWSPNTLYWTPIIRPPVLTPRP